MLESVRSFYLRKATRLVFAVGVAGLPGACSHERPFRLVENLLQRNPDVVTPTAVLRGGDETVRQLLWQFQLGDKKQLTVPAVADDVQFRFNVMERAPLQITLKGGSDVRRDMTLHVNGKPVDVLKLEPGQAGYSFRVPGSCIRAGSNRAELQFLGGQPLDGKPRAVFESIAFGDGMQRVSLVEGPQPRLDQEADSEVGWYVEPSDTVLEAVGIVTSTKPSRCVIEVLFESDRIAKRMLLRTELKIESPTAVRYQLDLPGARGVPARVTMRFKSDRPPARTRWDKLVLKRSVEAGDQTKASAPVVARVATQRPNVVIFLVDSLRRDHLAIFNPRGASTPKLAECAAHAAVCDNAWSQSSWTMPSVASLFTGEYPAAHGVKGHEDQLHTSFTTLAECLKQQGYRTVACIANSGVGARGGYDQGFDVWQYKSRVQAGDLVDRSLEQIGQEPFFLYAHFMDVHYPYDPAPAPFDAALRRFDDAPIHSKALDIMALRRGIYHPTDLELDYIQSLYDSEVSFVDSQFGRMMQTLKDRGIYDRTLVIFLADHGEEFRDHGGWYHGYTLYSELTHIGVLIKPPFPYTGRRLGHSVQMIDLYPTIASMAGKAPQGLPGRDLTDLLHNASPGRDDAYPIFSETDLHARRSVVFGRYKLILDDHREKGTADGARLFQIGVDPGEELDRAQSEPIRAAYLACLLRRHQEDLLKRFHFTREELHRTLDDQTRRELEALGYLGDIGK